MDECRFGTSDLVGIALVEDKNNLTNPHQNKTDQDAQRCLVEGLPHGDLKRGALVTGGRPDSISRDADYDRERRKRPAEPDQDSRNDQKAEDIFQCSTSKG
jgi:hypothetical protein